VLLKNTKNKSKLFLVILRVISYLNKLEKIINFLIILLRSNLLY
jgi:hypothetical protein